MDLILLWSWAWPNAVEGARVLAAVAQAELWFVTLVLTALTGS